MQTTDELQSKIIAAADGARGSYTDMVGVIGRMGMLASDAFKSNDELIAFSELMQKPSRVGGSGTMEQQAGNVSAQPSLDGRQAAGRRIPKRPKGGVANGKADGKTALAEAKVIG